MGEAIAEEHEDAAAELLGRVARGFLARCRVASLRELERSRILLQERARLRKQRPAQRSAPALPSTIPQRPSIQPEGAALKLQCAFRAHCARARLRELRELQGFEPAQSTPSQPSEHSDKLSVGAAARERDVAAMRVEPSLGYIPSDDAHKLRHQLSQSLSQQFDAVKAHRYACFAADPRAWWKPFVEQEDANLQNAIRIEAQRRAERTNEPSDFVQSTCA